METVVVLMVIAGITLFAFPDWRTAHRKPDYVARSFKVGFVFLILLAAKAFHDGGEALVEEVLAWVGENPAEALFFGVFFVVGMMSFYGVESMMSDLIHGRRIKGRHLGMALPILVVILLALFWDDIPKGRTAAPEAVSPAASEWAPHVPEAMDTF